MTPLEEQLNSSNKNEQILFLQSSPEYFDEAIHLALSGKQPYSWKAAFLIFHSMEENDPRIKKHINALITCIKDKEDGHQRELLKIIYKMEPKEKYEGILFDTCIGIWEQIDKSPSVRSMAMKSILKIVKRHPDLINEISFLTQNHYLETLSPGIKNSVYRMVEEITTDVK